MLYNISWQAFERLLARTLLALDYEGVRLVGQSGDGGADILATRHGKRWLIQVKRWAARVGLATIDKTLQALRVYDADVPLVVSLGGFDAAVLVHQRRLLAGGIPLQLWDKNRLLEIGRTIAARDRRRAPVTPRDYQQDALSAVQDAFSAGRGRALIVLATGLGKTFVAAEWFRRTSASNRSFRLLVLAHTNELVYQLERAFWPIISDDQDTVVWNGIEKPEPGRLSSAKLVFACLSTVFEYLQSHAELPPFAGVLVDECHHAGAPSYLSVLREIRAGQPGGPFLLGLTATPWRADDVSVLEIFGDPVISVDIVTGLRRGFLTNVDYRMFTDNIDWSQLANLRGGQLTPRRINRTLFIDQWDDGVIDALQNVWSEQERPRAIVFCGTIDHAMTVRDRVNARRFCHAEAIFSMSAGGFKMSAIERNRVLANFQDNRTHLICVVDVFNEGIDVPDVNIIVFQRVTHSRRIFVQQLGRGLRLSPDKDKVIVLDFVSDIRRFAAGLDLKAKISKPDADSAVRVRLPHSVTFQRLGRPDDRGENFITEWIEDVAALETAGEDASVLRFPPLLDSL